MMRGGTLLILGHGVKGQGQFALSVRGYSNAAVLVWLGEWVASVRPSLRLSAALCLVSQFLPHHFQTSPVSFS